MQITEEILRNKIQSKSGWDKTETPKLGRIIKIGNERNCNDDGIITNFAIRKDIEDIMKKYDIESYLLDKIHTKFEFSYQIFLSEEVYKDFSDKLTN